MDVGAARHAGRIDLDGRADHDDRGLRLGIGQRRDAFEIDALVEDAEKAKARTRQVCLIAGPWSRQPRRAEMSPVDARRKTVDIVVQRCLRLVERTAAGEDEIGLGEQAALCLLHLVRCASEFGELVHAVVDDERGLQLIDEAHHHRRIKPEDAVCRLGRRDAGGEQFSDRLGARLVRHAAHEKGRCDHDPGFAHVGTEL